MVRPLERQSAYLLQITTRASCFTIVVAHHQISDDSSASKIGPQDRQYPGGSILAQ
jgi:hypothetical protein